MNALIIDDDKLFSTILIEYCKKKEITVAANFEDPLKALDFLMYQSVDLIFLDIHLPDLNGFEFIENIPNSKIIITTVDETTAVKAFDYNVIDFLLKPITFNRFLKAIQRVEQLMQNNGNNYLETNHIYVNINKKLIKISVDEIDFIEANGNYSKIHLNINSEVLTVHTALKKIEESLSKNQFMQVHRSFIINLRKIVDIEDNSFVIGKKVIPLGKNFRGALLQKLNLIN